MYYHYYKFGLSEFVCSFKARKIFFVRLSQGSRQKNVLFKWTATKAFSPPPPSPLGCLMVKERLQINLNNSKFFIFSLVDNALPPPPLLKKNFFLRLPLIYEKIQNLESEMNFSFATQWNVWGGPGETWTKTLHYALNSSIYLSIFLTLPFIYLSI